MQTHFMQAMLKMLYVVCLLLQVERYQRIDIMPFSEFLHCSKCGHYIA